MKTELSTRHIDGVKPVKPVSHENLASYTRCLLSERMLTEKPLEAFQCFVHMLKKSSTASPIPPNIQSDIIENIWECRRKVLWEMWSANEEALEFLYQWLNHQWKVTRLAKSSIKLLEVRFHLLQISLHLTLFVVDPTATWCQ
jgi:hypothetical protein